MSRKLLGVWFHLEKIYRGGVSNLEGQDHGLYDIYIYIYIYCYLELSQFDTLSICLDTVIGQSMGLGQLFDIFSGDIFSGNRIW